MVGMIKRMRRLKELLDIRLGPGAVTMKPEVKRIHMQFARRINDGHMGPRKFWHHMLPRLKYHNPAIPMTVDVTDDQAGPASLYVYFAQASSPSQPASGASSSPEREEIIDMKHKTDVYILEEFTKLVDGQQIEATEQEREELAAFDEQRMRSDRDRALQKEVLAKQRREQEILEQARRSAQVQAG